ncbi:MAG: DUF4058 family protein [Caldilineaceae bacterium]
MGVVCAVKNQYLGVNAHMHSLWQGMGKWNRFHNVHIAQLLMALKAQLLPMGYTAETEESLQIRRLTDSVKLPRADILIGNLDPYRALQPSAGFTEGQSLALADLIEEDEDLEHPFYAVAIYERLTRPELSVPVAWLELLSPSNKGKTFDAHAYRAKRKRLLQSGLVFVELDYLHETPPTFEHLPDYTLNAEGSHPYRIVVLDPRPNFRSGRVALHQFDVDSPIPTVEIPLHGADRLRFDFDKVYQKTFAEALYGFDMDYQQLPVNFTRYSRADRTRIGARLVAVLQAAVDGVDLETGPFATATMTLDEAQTCMTELTQKLELIA